MIKLNKNMSLALQTNPNQKYLTDLTYTVDTGSSSTTTVPVTVNAYRLDVINSQAHLPLHYARTVMAAPAQPCRREQTFPVFTGSELYTRPEDGTNRMHKETEHCFVMPAERARRIW